MREARRTAGWRRHALSRRALLRAAGGAAVGSAALAAGAACGDGEDKAASAVAGAAEGPRGPVIGPLDQNKQRRFGTGLIGWNPDKTFDGYTLFCPSLGSDAFVIDMNGNVVKEWPITDPDSEATVWSVELLENGNIFVFVHEPTGDAPDLVFKGGYMMQMDWDGNEVWRLVDPDQHHDARMLPNGNLLVLRAEPVPTQVAARVRGGVPGTEEDEMWTDWVVETTKDGETVWEWHAWEHLDPEVDIINQADTRAEWTHGNSVDQLPNGDLLISFRNINTVAIADRDTGEITWKLAAPTLAQQHHARHLPNGNIMIFDNGAHRLDNALPYSRVIEVDPQTDEIQWEYKDPTLYNFFSPFISGAQRLENGNRLITEGNFGRIFEVTEEGELVWEYVSPYFTVNPFVGENNGVFRAFRYAESAFNRT